MHRRHPSTALRSIRAALAVAVLAAAGAVVAVAVHRTGPEPGSLEPSAGPVDWAAAASSTALRLSGPQPASPCQQIAYDIARAQPGTKQVVVVLTASTAATTGTLQVADLTADRGWMCGTPLTVRVGRNGVRPLPDRRSGDGTTPAGVFPLGRMTAWDGQQFSFFGNSSDPGVSAGPYRRVRTGDCFGATPNTNRYGHLVQLSSSQCTGADEYLPTIGAYTHAALIGANTEPDVSGDAPGEIPYASAIFLHRHSYVSGTSGTTKPTSGCVSLAQSDLAGVLRAMRPGMVFAIGQTTWLLAHTEALSR